MCMFSGPVHVAATKIFASVVDGKQLTAYQMEFEMGPLTRSDITNDTTPPGVAMILPVPWTDTDPEIALIDLSASKDFFDQIKKLVPRSALLRKSRGVMIYAASAEPPDSLEVHKVGNFDVSIAYSTADIERANPDVFTLSSDARETLEKNYKTDFAFVICALRVSGGIHPIAYIHTARKWAFVPTRHEHGNGVELPEWDHDIYVNGSGEPFRNPAGSPIRHHFTQGAEAQDPSAQRVKDALISKVPELSGFLSGQRINRYRFHGRFKNIDFRVKAD